jgi:predicted O-methyltransferase YrrM
MNIFRHFFRIVVEKIVSLRPKIFLDILINNHREFLIRNANSPSIIDLNDVRLPEKIDAFEDLSFLFFNCPLNRGIIRQDFDESSALFKYVRLLQNPTGVEIGRFNGGSTMLLAAAVGLAGKLVSIDIDPLNDEMLKEWLRRVGLLGRVELIKEDANKIILNEPVDFVLIDGDHTYAAAMKDHNHWGKYLKRGGFIFHHDMSNSRQYSTQWDELRRLRSDIINQQKNILRLVDETGSMATFQKISDEWISVK